MKTLKRCGVLLFLAMAWKSLLACSIIASERPEQPTEAQMQATSSLVFQGKVVAVHAESGPWGVRGGPHKYTFSVTQWIKGADATTVAVFDQLGSTCDMAEGRYHIIDADDPGAVEWRIFARKRGNEYWVITAHRLDRDWQ